MTVLLDIDRLIGAQVGALSTEHERLAPTVEAA
jgi:hypothetical protein